MIKGSEQIQMPYLMDKSVQSRQQFLSDLRYKKRVFIECLNQTSEGDINLRESLTMNIEKCNIAIQEIKMTDKRMTGKKRGPYKKRSKF